MAPPPASAWTANAPRAVAVTVGFTVSTAVRVDFGAGACGLALHAGKSAIGSRPPKIVFYAADVSAVLAALVKRGLTNAGKVNSADRFDMCDCKDPDGNTFQISSRR